MDPNIVSPREPTFDSLYFQKDLNGTVWPRLPFGRGGTLLDGPLPVGPLFDEHWAQAPDCDAGKCLSASVGTRDTYRLVGANPLDGKLVTQRAPAPSANPLPTEMHALGDGHVHGPQMFSGDFHGWKDPSALEMIQVGLALAIPEYAYGLCQHEGLHALFAALFGARVTSFDLLPSNSGGHFRFGQVQWAGNLSSLQKTLVFLGPKFGDLLGLTLYGLLDLTDNIPSNKHDQIPLLVMATGFWVDLSMGIISGSHQNDMDQAYSLMGLSSEGARLLSRFAHAAIAAGAGIPVLRGFLRLFGHRSSPGEESESKKNQVKVEGYVELDQLGLRGHF